MDPDRIFDDLEYIKAFERSRAIPRPLRDWYCYDLLRRLYPREIVRVLDVGAGVGQFLEPMVSTANGLDLIPTVTLLDPSPSMIEQLQRSNSHGVGRHELVMGTLEGLSGDRGTHDAILMSEVIHLMPDHQVMADVVSGIVGDGVIGVRFGTPEQVATRDWYRWYPEAREIDVERSPALNALLPSFQEAGLTCEVRVVDESRWIPTHVFQDMMANRAFSSFRLIDQSLHRRQSEMMRTQTSGRSHSWLSYEMTWVLARRPIGV